MDLQEALNQAVESFARTAASPDRQSSLFDAGPVSRPRKQPVEAAKPSLLEKIADEQKANRVEPLPGQQSLFSDDLEPIHHAIGKRFQIPPHAVKSLLETHPDELARRDDYIAPSNTDSPTKDFERLPLHSARIASLNHRAGQSGESYVDYLREFDPKELLPTEPEDGIKKSKTYQNYLSWAKQGIQPPYISVYSQTNGKPQLVTSNRRRTLAAQDAGIPSITGWHGPYNPETGNPLKYGDILRAANEFRQQSFSRDEIGPVEFAYRGELPARPKWLPMRPERENKPVHKKLTVSPEPEKGGWKKVGGSSVYTDEDGKILKGCPGLKGENIDDLINESDESRREREARQTHAEAAGITGHDVNASEARQLGRSRRVIAMELAKAAAKRHEVATADVLREMPSAYQHLAHQYSQRELARQAARKKTGLNEKRINRLEDSGKDHASIVGFDDVAMSMAYEHPELGWNPQEANGGKLWELLKEPRDVIPPKLSQPVAELAAELIANAKRSRVQPQQPVQQKSEFDEWAPDPLAANPVGDAFESKTQPVPKLTRKQQQELAEVPFSRTDELWEIANRIGLTESELLSAISGLSGDRDAIRDRDGHVVGSIARKGDKLVIRDEKTHVVGTVTKSGGRMVFRSRDGHVGASIGEFSRKPAEGQKSLEWNEDEHPRESDGEFAEKSESGTIRSDGSTKLGSQGFKINKVDDTRQYEEVDDDKWEPIPGSGHDHACDRCGKNHVIHYHVTCRATGKSLNVGSECAGLTGVDDKSKHKTIQSAASTVKKLEFMRDSIQKKLEKIPEMESKVSEMDFPEWSVQPSTIFKSKPGEPPRFELVLGDLRQQLPESYHNWKQYSPHLASQSLSDAKSSLNREWKSDRLGELVASAGMFDPSRHGKSYGAYLPRKLRDDLDGVEKRLAKAKKKMESLTDGEQVEFSRPRNADGTFTNVLKHKIKTFLSTGGNRLLREIHEHTGHTEHDPFDLESNPASMALKQLRDADEISGTKGHGEPSFYMTDDQRDAFKSAPDSKPKHEFSSTHFCIDDTDGNLKKLVDSIDKKDLHPEETNDELHVTIKYGIHTESPEEIKRAVAGFGPVKIRLGKTSVFADDGKKGYDVVKVEVSGDKLHQLNKIVKNCTECTDTYPTYKPHMTIAYVKSGTGEKYAGDDSVDGTELTFDHFVFSGKDGKTSKVPLVGPVEFARKPAGGQTAFFWDDDEPKHDPEENNAELKQLRQIHGSDRHFKKVGNDWHIRAKKGGEQSTVNNKWYKGGQWMPIHGLSEKKSPTLFKPENPKSPAPTITPNPDRQPRQAMSQEEIEALRQKREDDAVWADIQRSPLGRLLDLGDKPRYKQGTTPITDHWREYAERIGPDAMSELKTQLEKEVHDRIDSEWADHIKTESAMTDDEIRRRYGIHGSVKRASVDDAEWDKNQLKESANSAMEWKPRTGKAIEKSVPGTHYVRELIGHLLSNGKGLPIGEMKRIGELLANYESASRSSMADPAAAKRAGYYPNKFPGVTSSGVKVKSGSGWVKKNQQTGKYETFTDEEVKSSLSGPVEFSVVEAEASPHDQIMGAIPKIEKDAHHGALVSTRDLRNHTGLPKPVFDRTIFDLVRSGKLSPHHHDFATGLHPDKLAELVDTAHGDPERAGIHANAGRYWVGVALRPGPVEFARRPPKPASGQGSFGWSDDEQLHPVESSNVYGYRFEPGGPGGGNLIVQYKNRQKDGPGPEYRYFTGGKNAYDMMNQNAKTGGSSGKFVWSNLRIRGTKSGHTVPYELAGTGPDKYIPRQAGLKRGHTGEWYNERKFQGQTSQLAPGPVRKSNGPIPGYNPSKLSITPNPSSPVATPRPQSSNSLLDKIRNLFRKRKPDDGQK